MSTNFDLPPLSDDEAKYVLPVLKSRIEAKYMALAEEAVSIIKPIGDSWELIKQETIHGEGIFEIRDGVEEVCDGIVRELSKFEVEILSLYTSNGMSEEWEELEKEDGEVYHPHLQRDVSAEISRRVEEIADYEASHSFETSELFQVAKKFLGEILFNIRLKFAQDQKCEVILKHWEKTQIRLPVIGDWESYSLEIGQTDGKMIRIELNETSFELVFGLREQAVEDEECEPDTCTFYVGDPDDNTDEMIGKIKAQNPAELVSRANKITLKSYPEKISSRWDFIASSPLETSASGQLRVL